MAVEICRIEKMAPKTVHIVWDETKKEEKTGKRDVSVTPRFRLDISPNGHFDSWMLLEAESRNI
jgi:hypothetical protein